MKTAKDLIERVVDGEDTDSVVDEVATGLGDSFMQASKGMDQIAMALQDMRSKASGDAAATAKIDKCSKLYKQLKRALSAALK